jgi:cytochrome b
MALASEATDSASRQASDTGLVTIRVWDAPLRVFHWLLLAAVATAIATGLAGGEWMAWHGRAGLAIVGLLTFRVVWGLVGSTTSRFSHFFPTPARLRAYFSGAWQGVGHNPLGAFSVFALLGLLALQVGTGLFSNDDIAFAGPLAQWASEETVSDLTGWHHRLINLLYGLIGLHIAAIIFYALVKRERLVPPMVTGKKTLEPGVQVRTGTSRHRIGALVLAIALAGLATWAASGEWIAQPAPPPASTAAPAPAW